MNTHPTSHPSLPSAPRGFGHNALVGIIGGAFLLSFVVAAGLWVSSRGDSSSPAAPAVSSNAVSQASRSASTFATTNAGGGHTVYIVRSEEQAATVMAGIDEANAIRALSGEPLLLDSVVVAGSAAEAAGISDAVTEGNRIFAGLGVSEETVVDLGSS